MFKKPNIPIYLDDVSPAMGKDKAGDERLDTLLTFRIHPLSPELASELDMAVRNTLWSVGKVEVSEKVKSIVFELKVPAFAMAFKAAPDSSRPSILLPYGRVEGSAITAKKHKDVGGWALTFKARVTTPDAQDLAKLHHGYTKQHFITFEAAAPDLIAAMEAEPDESEEDAAPPPRGRRGGAAKGAPDVH